MAHFDIVDQFVRMVEACRTTAALHALMAEAIAEIGFDYFALIHHVDLARTDPGVIHIQNYPPRWADYFIRNKLYLCDPVLHASIRTGTAFRWADMSKMMGLSRCHRSILTRARREGVGEGITVPVNVPGEPYGSCSFAVRTGRLLPSSESLQLAHLIGSIAFQAARRIVGLDAVQWREPVPLTPRQVECVLWAARAKTDWEIAQILGIKEDTVTKHINAARDRYGVLRRNELIVRALYDGHISFQDVVSFLRPLYRREA